MVNGELFQEISYCERLLQYKNDSTFKSYRVNVNNFQASVKYCCTELFPSKAMQTYLFMFCSSHLPFLHNTHDDDLYYLLPFLCETKRS